MKLGSRKRGENGRTEPQRCTNPKDVPQRCTNPKDVRTPKMYEPQRCTNPKDVRQMMLRQQMLRQKMYPPSLILTRSLPLPPPPTVPRRYYLLCPNAVLTNPSRRE